MRQDLRISDDSCEIAFVHALLLYWDFHDVNAGNFEEELIALIHPKSSDATKLGCTGPLSQGFWGHLSCREASLNPEQPCLCSAQCNKGGEWNTDFLRIMPTAKHKFLQHASVSAHYQMLVSTFQRLRCQMSARWSYCRKLSESSMSQPALWILTAMRDAKWLTISLLFFLFNEDRFCLRCFELSTLESGHLCVDLFVSV